LKGVEEKVELWVGKPPQTPALCVTVLLEWTQKHDSDRINKDECL